MNRSKCSECGLPFNDWFIFGSVRYCYPCYVKSKFERKIIYDESDFQFKFLKDKTNPKYLN